MGSRLNRQGPGGLHGLQAEEEVRTFFCLAHLEPAWVDPESVWVNFFGRASSSGLRRTDGRLKKGTHGPTVYTTSRVNTPPLGIDLLELGILE